MNAPVLSQAGESARSGDPDRFEAALFADDEAARERLFTLIALNLELARTRLRVSEPHIGLIRLQWWRDAIGEAIDGKPARAHELAAPVSAMIAAAPEGFAKTLLDMIDARERDLDPEPFETEAALRAYLADAAGAMMRLCAMLAADRPLTAEEEAAAASIGLADGVARAFEATPALAAENRTLIPAAHEARASLLKGAPDAACRAAINRLARMGLEALDLGERQARALPAESLAALKPALLASWRARRILDAGADPCVQPFEDFGPESPFRRRASLLWRGVFQKF